MSVEQLEHVLFEMDSPLAHVIYGRFSNKSKSNLNKSILSSKGSWKQVFYLNIKTTKEFFWLEDLLSKRVRFSSSNVKLYVLDTYVRLQLINKSDVLCLMCNGFMLTCLGSPGVRCEPSLRPQERDLDTPPPLSSHDDCPADESRIKTT